jgi:hypothetical protein
MALPATEAAPDSAGVAGAGREVYGPRPLSIWVTPAAGLIGNSMAAGGDLRFALANGWGASAGFTVGEELCVLCVTASEQFGAGALLAGYRGVGRLGYVSIAVGPNWGWGERPDRDFQGTIDDNDTNNVDYCGGLFCPDYDYPTVSDRGFGVQIQTQAALAGRYVGIGMQIQMIYIPRHIYGGATLILPIGQIK